ncbi:MAG TPA: 4Fe-4S ferredoxin, partial [Solirubrobacteraceae bacterium]
EHDAVIYAVGASSDRRLEIPGADLPGIASATEFVAWYNGHPDQADRSFDLGTDRAVVIGNGNVALDVARILALDPDRLADTTIAPAALAALRRSRIQEIVVVGRRGPAHAAFTVPELVGLSRTPGIELRVDPDALSGEQANTAKLEVLRQLPSPPAADRRVVLRFGLTPSRFTGSDRVTGAVLAAGDGATETIRAGLVLTSIGYRGRPVPDLPFDPATGTVPNDRGRVHGAHRTYVAGWIKRGPSGFIGTNGSCAQESVRVLIEDFNTGWPKPDQPEPRDQLARAA